MTEILHISPGVLFRAPRGRQITQANNAQHLTKTLRATASSTETTFPRIIEKNLKTGICRDLSNAAVNYNSSEQSTAALHRQPLSSVVRSFFMPQGWPHSVTTDYLQYQLYTFPSHVTGWMSHSLAGSSMLKALGVGAVGPAGAVGFTAAIKWVTKDGIGAVGRLFVGGRLSSVFDEDPKRWRMIAEAVTSLGLALEIATQLSPSNFILLAGTGTLAKATGKGMGRPCFRVVQTHFASTNNVGDVSAKEEVWEVAAQMAGLATSVALLSALEASGTPEAVVPLWACIHSVHVVLRYIALKKLRFPYPNYKRGVALATHYVRHGHVPSIEKVNAEEPMLQGPFIQGIRCIFGCSLDEFLISNSANLMELKDFVEIYKEEKYVLTLGKDGTAYIMLWESAGPIDMVRALWQTAWLHQHHDARDFTDLGKSTEIIKMSIGAMQTTFPDFERGAQRQGWDLTRSVFPCGNFRLELLDG